MAITLKIESVKLKLFRCFRAMRISTIISLLINFYRAINNVITFCFCAMSKGQAK